MKKILILWIGLQGFAHTLTAQLSLNLLPCTNCPAANANMVAPPTGFTYAAQPQAMQSQHIASDFGRRESVPGSNWHLGIDVATAPGDAEVGDGILPIEPGIVTGIRGHGAYKVLSIRGQHRFGYGHLFFDEVPGIGNATRCGNFLLKRLDPPHTGLFAIVNISANRALAEIDHGTVTHPSVNGGQPLRTTNIVADPAVPVAPIGSSSTTAAHIHLYRFLNDPIEHDFWSNMDTGYHFTRFRNHLDPLEVLDHAPAAYNLSIVNFNLTYPGTARTSVQVRAAMQGQTGGGPYSTANTLEEMALQLRRFDQADFATVKGLRVDNRIAEGSRTGSQRYPSLGVPAHNIGSGFWDIADHAQVGNNARTGINGMAYATQNYDSYFFTDIYTRISGSHVQNAAPAAAQNFARNNEEAYYSDGSYTLRALATNVRGVQTASPPMARVIDNFRPYVQSVTILAEFPFAYFQPIQYRRDLDCLPNGNLRMNIPQHNTRLDLNDAYRLVVRFSEPMRPLTLSVTNNRGLQFNPPSWDVSQREATFTIPAERLLSLAGSPNEWVCLTIQAQDHNGNALFNPVLMPGQPANIEVPKRGAGNVWTPVGVGTSDNNHCFRVKTCTGGNVAGENAPPNPNTRINGVRWATAPGLCDGRIDLTPGANVPYTYQWSHGATTEDADQLCPGLYSVTVVDAGGCDRVLYAQLDVCSGTMAIGTQMDCESRTATLTAIFPDCLRGTAQYTWSNGAQNATISGLTPGEYQVTATCAYNGCSAIAATSFGVQTAIQIVSVVPATQNCNGGAAVAVTGDAGPYAFLWSNGSAKPSLTDACAGVYVLTVTDVHGCTQSAQVTIGGCGGTLYAWESVVNPCSPQSPNGEIELEIFGCQGPYRFAWNHGATTKKLAGLLPGNYCVTVTSADQCCSTTKCVELVPALALSGNPVEACPDGSGGGVEGVRIDQVALPYRPFGIGFQWSDGSTGADLTSIPGGQYCVTATAYLNGAPHCAVERCFTVPQSDLQMLGLLRTSPCPGQSNGLIESQVLGGYQPYAYAWSNGQAQADLNGIPWGTYGLTVTDQMGCTVSAGATLWPALITLNGSVRNACSLLPDGQIELTLGAGPFSLQWSTGATGAHLNGLSPGQYCVTATNTNGCSGSACFQVGEDPPATAYRPSDCRYLDRYCHGQYVGSQFAGIAQTYVDHYYCTYNEACFNGQIYAQVQGFGGSGFFGGYQNGAPYCRYQEWCSFPDGTVVLGAGWPASVYSEIINVGYLECPSGMAWADYCDGTFMGIRCLNIAGPAERIAGEHPQPVADSLFMDLRIPTNGLDAHAAVSAALAETLGTAATGAEDRPSALDAPWWRIENNPFAQNIPLTAFSPRSRAATLRLTNALGQSVLEHRTTLAAGENRFALEVPGELPDGFYLLEMALDGRALPPIKCLRHRP